MHVPVNYVTELHTQRQTSFPTATDPYKCISLQPCRRRVGRKRNRNDLWDLWVGLNPTFMGEWAGWSAHCIPGSSVADSFSVLEQPVRTKGGHIFLEGN